MARQAAQAADNPDAVPVALYASVERRYGDHRLTGLALLIDFSDLLPKE